MVLKSIISLKTTAIVINIYKKATQYRKKKSYYTEWDFGQINEVLFEIKQYQSINNSFEKS